MEVNRIEGVKTKCDMKGCPNFADYIVTLFYGKKRCDTHICHACLNGFYTECGRFVVPQSPPNMLREKEI